MTRSTSHFYLAEGLATLGICFGGWLIYHTFQPASDLPNSVLTLLGGLDILICSGLLGYLLRLRLQEEGCFPKSWIVVSAILVAGYLGWITALLIDAERLRTEERFHQETEQHLTRLEDAIRQFQQLATGGAAIDRKRWDLIHDGYAREYDQLHTLLRAKPNWDKEVMQIHEQVEHWHQMVTNPPAQAKTDGPLVNASTRAGQPIEKLQLEVSQTRHEVAALHHARWHGIGSAALTSVFLLTGCMLLWLVFERELRRSRKTKTRLTASEAHFRSLVEHQTDAVAVLDPSFHILYVNPAWKSAFNYLPEDLRGRNLLELIHPQDRPQTQIALQQQDPQHSIPCRLSADYGVWHDVELQCQEHDEQSFAVRLRHVRETPDVPDSPSLKIADTRAEQQLAEAERQLQILAESERQAREELRREQGEREQEKQAHEQALRDHDQHRQRLGKSAQENEAKTQAHVQALRDHDQHRQQLEKSLREREEERKKLEVDLHERKKHSEQLEADLKEHQEHLRKRDRHRETLESALRDQQDRVHDLHRAHKRHATSLKASKEAMRRLASGVANDFNKLLSVILGYTDVLHESFPKDHLAQNYVEEMRQAANHGAELTQKLLAFSGNHLLQFVPVELNHELAALEGKLRDALGSSVQLAWERADEELWIKTDLHPLEQALVHLLTHARHRLADGGTLTIRTSRVDLTKHDLTHDCDDTTPGKYVRLGLHHHGVGLDEETRTHLFEPYYPTTEGHKSDLGLATANGIIRQNGGCIDVVSPSETDSEVVILLPWTDERPQQAAQDAAPLRASA